MIVLKPLHDWHTNDSPRMMAITLPTPAFDIPPADRSATAPTGRTIRGEADWRKDSVLRGAVRIKT